MRKISIKTIISILSAKFTLFLTKTILKGGTTFPGRVALKIDKNILSKVSKGYKVILVTGTNGKTTTTSMIYNIIKESGHPVITNNTGANLVTNLFRDQLDRYGEVYTTLNKILEGIYNVPETTLVLNGDESLLGKLDLKNPVHFYGFDKAVNDNKTIEINADAKFCKFCKTPYEYNFVTYNHLGDFYCPNCGYKRSDLMYAVTDIIDINADSSTIKFNDLEVSINQSGTYNIYNGLCAYSIAKELGIDDSVIKKSLENQSSSFGRQETINIEGKDVKIFLVKNPAGYNQSLDTICLNKERFAAAFLLNDNYADGQDVSWIWDVDFEKLTETNIDEVYISGLRAYDMAVRLKTAGLDPNKFVIEEQYEALTEAIKNGSCDKLYILATYTAMINYRKYLHSKGYIKNLW